MRMKQGDLYPFEYNLADSDGKFIDLASATVDISIYSDEDETLTVDRTRCLVIIPEEGKIQYQWLPGQTDKVGMYRIEFHVTFFEQTTITFPNNDVIWLFIVPSLRPIS